MNKKLLASGCSYTAGNGWADTDPKTSGNISVKDSPHLWINICHRRIDALSQLELINIGQGGASNTEIFENTVRAMTRYGDQIDTIFCQWTSMPRYNWNVGFELWDTSENLGDPNIQLRTHNVNLNRGDTWPREYVVDLTDRLRVMHHLHWEILKVVDYSAVISDLAHKLGIDNVFFINGMCPWDQDYFIELHNVKPEAYTDFTKTDILNIDSRNDADILELYQLAHRHYQERGGIVQARWLNLYASFNHHKVDTNFDQQHPGEISNLFYYEMIDQRLKDLGIV